MGKKTKQGKNRLDRYYFLAKDQGYRARSAFKLVQLAKKSDFLSKARVCIDLCAAPGGWSQIAQQNMPAGSLIIAIDLVPIKAIYGVTTMQADITTEKCRSMLKKELMGRPADVVLHDGAPNVGAEWSKDAFGQAELVLHSMKLACEHLRPGGTFVTKVFRSADYNSLIWVFNQLFSKVDATKPTASRNVSAEIFVVCLGFKAGKIDPRFFNPKWVFMETVDPKPSEDGPAKKPGAVLKDHFKVARHRHRSGYEPGDDNKIIGAHDFFASATPAEVLITHHKIDLKAPGSESLDEHPSTTFDVREICADLKVCGKRDLMALLKWRIKIIREQERQKRKEEKEALKHAVAVRASQKNARTLPETAGPPPADAQGVAESTKAPTSDATKRLSQDVDDAIAELLNEDQGAAADEGDKTDDGDSQEEELERDIAQQVEARRREVRREAKKTMARQKKQEMRKKMSLHGTKELQDMPELFKATARNIKALEDQDQYVDPRSLDSANEDSGDEEMSVFHETDSDDDGLDRYARMEVDLAVAHEMRKFSFEANFRNRSQRLKKKKKETRRQRVIAAWAGELGAFNDSINKQAAADYVLRDKEDAEDDDSEDSDDALQVLRDAQARVESSGAVADGLALEALADGPEGPRPERQEDEDDDAAAEEEGGEAEAPQPSSSREIVPVEDAEELARAEERAARWFSQDIFAGVGPQRGELKAAKRSGQLQLGSDSEGSEDAGESKMRELPDNQLPNLPLTDRQKRKLKRKKDNERLERLGKKPKTDLDNSPLEVAPLEAPKPLVPVPEGSKFKKPKDPQELAETLALGSLLVESKKSRMELIDAAYNRWTFDRDEMLPEWFLEDEERWNKPDLPISKELMQQYRKKLREINARPIRKVLEARARKKRRLQKKLEKLRSTAMSLVDAGGLSDLAKAREMRKAVNKMAKQDKRKVSVVAVKKGGGGRTDKGKIPKGAKVKVVDKRMKADKRGEKKALQRNKKKQKAMNRKLAQKKARKKDGGPVHHVRESGGKRASR